MMGEERNVHRKVEMIVVQEVAMWQNECGCRLATRTSSRLPSLLRRSLVQMGEKEDDVNPQMGILAAGFRAKLGSCRSFPDGTLDGFRAPCILEKGPGTVGMEQRNPKMEFHWSNRSIHACHTSS